MRFGDRRTSDNVESQRGQNVGGRFGGGGGGLGGAGANMLFGLVASRFGIGGVIVLALLFFAFGGGLGDLLGGGGGQQALTPQEARQSAQPAGEVCQSDEVTRFSCQVLASTEEQWGAMFTANGSRYAPPRMVFYDRRGSSGCGAADSAMGPFYCPADQRIYLDTQFFRELAQRFAAPGDFAQAYVIAHEVGHHVQTITGVTDRIRGAQHAVGEAQGNALQVRMELQADCYAGVWASREQGIMEEGDLEEGMRAAAAIGDDTLQRAAQGTVVPESFTHGSAAQRQEALMRGFRGGGPAACDVYMQGV
jgi:predicted metalloprotease